MRYKAGTKVRVNKEKWMERTKQPWVKAENFYLEHDTVDDHVFCTLRIVEGETWGGPMFVVCRVDEITPIDVPTPVQTNKVKPVFGITYKIQSGFLDMILSGKKKAEMRKICSEYRDVLLDKISKGEAEGIIFLIDEDFRSVMKDITNVVSWDGYWLISMGD